MIGQRLHIALHNGEEITIEYYRDGFIEEVIGRLTFIDTQLRRIKVAVNDWDFDWLWLDDVLSVK